MTICRIEGCAPGKKIIARSLCSTHYGQWYKGRLVVAGMPAPKGVESCSVAGCIRFARVEDVCEAHYQRIKKHGDARADVPIVSRTGTYTDSDGYVVISVPVGTVMEVKRKSALNYEHVFEHQKIMSEKIGRLLKPGETVHHKNGVRDDNRPENLELWVGAQPRGCRVKDQILWAKNILETYGEDESKW
jgi:HNH endonuclease